MTKTKAIAAAQPPMLLSYRLSTLAMFTSAIMLFTMHMAYATGSSSPMGDALCAIVDIVYGNLGRGLASLAVIIVGVGATLGKTSWSLALTVAVGISVIFNADTIITSLNLGQNAAAATCS